jgi:hypothetical protein
MNIKGRTRMAALLCGLLLWIGPTAAAAAADALRLVWAADRGQGFDIFTAVQEENGWGPSTRLVDGPEADLTPACSVDQGGRLWLVWIARDREGRSQLRYRIDALGRKPRDGRIVTGYDDNYAPVVLIDRKGAGWVAWASYTGSSDEVFASRFDGTGWSAPLRVHAANDQPDVKPFLSLARDGGVQVSWLGFRENGYQRFQSRWNGAGFVGERVVEEKVWARSMRKIFQRKMPPLPYETKKDGMVSAVIKKNNENYSIPDWVFFLRDLED